MASLTKDYRGRLAALTGASSGIGYELAKVFAKNGFDLILAGQHDRIWTVTEEIRAMGTKVTPVQCDLATAEGVDAFLSKILTAGTLLDSLVVNAGFGFAFGGEFVDTDLEEEVRLIELNTVSIVRLTKFILPDFVVHGVGRILFTSAIPTEMPGPYYAVYAASKAFVRSFAEAIRAEVKDRGVTITTLRSDGTEADIFKSDPAEIARASFDALMSGRDQVVMGSFPDSGPLRMAKPARDEIPKSLN